MCPLPGPMLSGDSIRPASFESSVVPVAAAPSVSSRGITGAGTGASVTNFATEDATACKQCETPQAENKQPTTGVDPENWCAGRGGAVTQKHRLDVLPYDPFDVSQSFEYRRVGQCQTPFSPCRLLCRLKWWARSGYNTDHKLFRFTRSRTYCPPFTFGNNKHVRVRRGGWL